MKSLYEKALELEVQQVKLRDDLFKIILAGILRDDASDIFAGINVDDNGRMWPDLSKKLWENVDDMMKARNETINRKD